MRTPETLTAVQRAERLKQQGSDDMAAQPPGAPAPTPSADSKSMTTAQDRMRESARTALHKGSSNATAGLDPMEELDGSVAILSIHDIDAYKYNPRTKPNPKRAEIKASMAAEGITNIITVTRRSPKEKYFPYGGGNTRIDLAKELFAEGHTKFAQITVITKKWPGEAAVISAHLSENDNRGDISFWERAQGVASFKREFEGEFQRVLTAAELNKELKESGLNYGIKMIQNFGFATENLDPVGPWLRTDDVNGIIRPIFGALFDIAGKFDLVGEVKAATDEILLMHGQDLEALDLTNRELEAAEREEVKLDVQSFITDLQSVAAKVLKLDVDRMPAAIQAVVQNPTVTADDIRKARTETQTSAAPPQTGQQLPLGPLLGAVRKGPPGKAQPPAPTTNASGTDIGATETLAAFGRQLTADVMALHEVLPIADFFRAEPGLPFGFMVDFPPSMSEIDGQALSEEQSGLREAMWPVLATISGQCNAALADQCGAGSAWAQTLAAGPEAMASKCAESGVLFRSGVMYLTSLHVWMILAHPQIGPAFSAVLKTLSEFHQQFPGKTQVPFKALFPK